MLRTVGFVFVFLFAAGSLFAQTPAQTFEQLSTRISAGDSIKILDVSAAEIKGHLEEISALDLAISTGRSVRRFSESQVREVWHQQKDPVGNGILIGISAGAAAGFLAPAGFCGGFNDSECSAIVRVVFVPIGAGVGAVSGWLVDRAMRRSVLVYSPRTGFQFSFRF
jgi:hypothetical protein